MPTVYQYLVSHDVEQHECRVLVNTIYKGRNLPPPYQSMCFWPVNSTELNSDLIQFRSIEGATIDGQDFSFIDRYIDDSDNKRSVKETELAVRSVPPLWDKIEIGVLEFEMSLKSKILPKVGLFNFHITFMCDRLIFDPKHFKSSSVWFHESAKVSYIGSVLNLYRGANTRNDNWFQLRFSQMISILDPEVEIKFGLQINKVKPGFPEGTIMDITYIVSWVNSITSFQHVDGEGVVEGSGSAALRATNESSDESPTSSFETLVLDIVDHRS